MLPIHNDTLIDDKKPFHYESQHQYNLTEDILITWKTQKYDFLNNKLEYSDGVEVIIDSTIISADQLEIFPEKKFGKARGNVRLIVPEGSFEADELIFDWKNGNANASKVIIYLAGIHFKASVFKLSSTTSPSLRPGDKNLQQIQHSNHNSLSQGNQKIILKDVELKFDPNSILQIDCDECILNQSKANHLKNLKITLFNRIRFRKENLLVSLSPSSISALIPNVSFNRNGFYGFKYEHKMIVDDNFSLRANLGKFGQNPVTYEAETAWSPKPMNENQGKIAPLKDLKDRFYTSPWDNVLIWDPKKEYRDLSEDLTFISLTTNRNQAADYRVVFANCIIKPWDLTFENGGKIGQLGYTVQTRFQNISDGTNRKYIKRNLTSATITTPEYGLTDYLSARLRLDGASFVCPRIQSYAWYRAQIATNVKCNKVLDFGIAYNYGQVIGSPFFLFDIPYMLSGINLRSDLKLGDFRFSALAKYDIPKREWVDLQLGLTLKAGAFEPYFAWKRYNDEIYFGFNLILGKTLNKIQKRIKENR